MMHFLQFIDFEHTKEVLLLCLDLPLKRIFLDQYI